MKIKQDVLEIDRGEDDYAIEASIDAKSLPFLFDIVSTSLYSDPLGSLIREITSNCVDSHVAAKKKDEPIIIQKEYDYEDGLYYIKFIDSGIGMSPEKICNTYMNYFSSDKRDSDELIGGFGLGSKSPLSYQDMFYITTVYNNIKYEYILHKDDGKPKLESIHGFEEIEEVVLQYVDEGIETPIIQKVKIPIGISTTEPNGTVIKVELKEDDIWSILEEKCKQQLAYFDKVYFKDFFNVGNSLDGKVYDTDTFKYRNNYQPRQELHVIIDQVVYDIDFKKLNIKPIKLPIGIKFGIDELLVNPQREALRYTPEIIELLKQRIDECIINLKEIYDKQNPLITDILEYIKIRDQRVHINFGDTKLHIPSDLGFEKSSNFSVLDGIKIPYDPFFMYTSIADLEGSNNNYYDLLQAIKRNNKVIVINKESVSKYKNKFIKENYTIDDDTIYRRKKLSYSKYCKELGLSGSYNANTGQKIKDHTLGKSLLIKKFLDYVDNYVKRNYIDYDSIQLSPELIAEYKKEELESTLAYQRKINKTILIRDHNNDRKEVSIKDIENAKLVIYQLYSTQELNKLDNLYHLLVIRGSLKKMYLNKKLIFINISKTNFRFIKNNINLIEYKDLHKTPILNNFFRDSLLAHQINRFLTEYDDIYIWKYSNYYKIRWNELESFKSKHLNSRINYENFSKIVKHKKLKNEEIELLFNELKEVLPKLEILRYVNFSIPEHYAASIVKNLKVLKLNQNYYSNKKQS